MLSDSFGRLLPICVCRSPTSAICAARTACRPRDLTGCLSPRCSPTTRWCGWSRWRWSCSASARSGSPAASRCCAAIWRSIIASDRQLRPRPEISLTTNGIGLAGAPPRCATAGLDRVNVSLDTLRPEVFRKLARRDRLPDVLDGLAAAADGRARPGQGQRGADARPQRRRGCPAAAVTASTAATSCGSSSRCRWTRSTAGTAPRW